MCYSVSMMRWKILELAGKEFSLEEILTELEGHAELGLDRDAALQILNLYKDILSEDLQRELDHV